MILEIDNVELYFKEKRILNGIYLKAETGKTTGILGSNGSGKSCLLNIIFGTQQAKYQLIRLDKQPLLKPLYLSKEASFLPQHNFIPNRVKIASAFKLFNVDFNEFIKEFPQFENYKKRAFNKLSGGEQRMIEIYLILKKKGKIILLDEPFNGIAPLFIEKIKNLIKAEKQEKIIILTDHRYTEVIDISDSIYLIKNGCTKLINELNELEDYKYVSKI